MATMVAAPKKQVHRFEVSGAAADLFRCYDPEILIEGPAGTGKTRAVCELAHSRCMTYPGCRVLFVRKTRVSMTESVLVTWERDVLPPNHPCISGGAGRANRHSYIYPNGSEIVCGGMDNSDRIMSTEYDLVCFFEATELSLEDFEKATSRLRNHRIPHPEGSHPRELRDEAGEPDIDKIRSAFASGVYPDGLYADDTSLFLEQAICDCNPGPEWHWLNQRPMRTEMTGPRAGSSVMTRLLSRHEDNPTVTRAYMDKLRNLTGPRRARLYEGLWVTAEGLVWPNFNPHEHVIDGALSKSLTTGRWNLFVYGWGPQEVELSWFFASLDWGYRAPGVLQVWGVDKRHRAFMVYECMRTQRDKMWWAELAEEKRRQYDVQRFACDPAEPATIEMFNHRMGKVGGHWICVGAENDFPAGTDVVRQRFAANTVFFLRNAPDGADADLVESSKPTCTADEITGYSYEEVKDGMMIRERAARDSDDHGCDALRYGMMFLDRSNWQPMEPQRSFRPGTYGAMLGHDQVKFGLPLWSA